MEKVIITGGNSGIGYQAAKQLAEKGVVSDPILPAERSS